jgi:hypothetical protein
MWNANARSTNPTSNISILFHELLFQIENTNPNATNCEHLKYMSGWYFKVATPTEHRFSNAHPSIFSNNNSAMLKRRTTTYRFMYSTVQYAPFLFPLHQDRKYQLNQSNHGSPRFNITGILGSQLLH